MPVAGYRFYGRNVRPYLYAPEKKSYTILGMTLFSLIVFGAFAIRPSLSTISRLSSEAKKAREAKALLDQKINDLSQAQINYQLALEDRKLIDRALPKDADVPTLLESLALAAGRSKVTLRETALEPVEDGNLSKVLPLMVVVVGKLNGVEEFITELEEGIRQMDVRKVRITRGGGESDQLTAKIEFVVYFSRGVSK